MSDFKQYIITVSAVAIVGCIAITICDKKTTSSAMIKLIVGVLVTLTVFKPLIDIKISDISGYLSSVNTLSADCIQSGSLWADSETAAIIKERSEAYILDKASSMGVQIEVEVSVLNQTPFQPETVTITGSVPPYARTQLSDNIETDIGISKENQIWTK